MIEGFKVISELGQGGFGKVFLAEEIISNKLVAIKSITINLLDDLDFILNEVKTISKFNHPNIVQYYHAHKDDSNLYIVMEYCSDGSLMNFIRNAYFTQERAVETILTIAKTLDFINKKGIIHNDIKPENILINEEQVVKISDFGVANTNIHTRKYMPPAKLINNTLNSSYHPDIFALGITFIELLCNKIIFVGLTDDQRADKIFNKDFGVGSFPFWIQEIIFKMLSLNAEYKFNSMEEIVEAIETRNIPFKIDNESIIASNYARNIKSLLKRKKLYTVKLIVDKIDYQLKQYSSILLVLSEFYLMTNNYTKAEVIFNALKRKLPSVDVNKELAIIYMEKGRYGLAINYISEYLNLHPADCESYNILLECYYKTRRYKDGQDLADALSKQFPNEVCFKTNKDLFFYLLNNSHLDDIEAYNPYLPNNKISTFNKDVVLKSHQYLNSSNKLTDKLLFCHYSITRSKKINQQYEIYCDGVKFESFPMALITIGRKKYNNTIEFDDDNVSRKNAILILLENENWIYELNGVKILVDNIQVKGRMRLYYNHEIKISNHIIDIRIDKTKLF